MKAKILTLLKAWSGRILLGVVVLSVGAFFIFRGEETTEDYLLLGNTDQGDITLSISDSGQVSDAEEIEITPNASSKVTAIYVDEGSYVSAGDLLLELDYEDALLNISEAEISLEQAEQDLQELLNPADEIDIKKAENDVIEAENAIKERAFQYQDDYEALEKTIEDYHNQIADNTDQIEDYQSKIEDTEENILDAETTDQQSAMNSAYSAVADIMVNLGEIMNDLDEIVTGSFSGQQKKLSQYSWATTEDEGDQLEKVEDEFYEASASYDSLFTLYQSASRSDLSSIRDLTDAAYEAVSFLSESYKELDVFLTLIYEHLDPSDSELYIELTTDRSTVATNISRVNPYLSTIYDEVEAIDALNDSIEDYEGEIEDYQGTILDYEEDIQDLNKSIASSENDFAELDEQYELDLQNLRITVEEKQLDLIDLQAGDVSESDIRAQLLVVRQRENSLKSTQESYADYFLYAPVSGYISSWDVDVGESISSSTIIGNLIDNNKQVIVSLNELDILDIEIGQTAKITFDAIPDFKTEGVVVKKDVAGTVNSGVVSYDVTLSVQSEDERILTGMSADVDIVLLSKPGVTLVSKMAVKEDQDGKYVEVVQNADSLEMQPFYSPEVIETEKAYIEVGDEDEVNYEVLSGLKVGDRIVLSTISLSSEEDTSGAFGLPGGGEGPGSGEFTPPRGGGNFEGGPPIF
ncbi:MAG: RND family efflux transporter MFP subunit, HlyD family secretion protein [Candidatus Peregrinibacteria bacterium GW2011_GWF2_39_17]|nr:MAG: RND family efflux transporter MFP subunit, HlyD family secretion protein [Candidatus Peregrinibacteria bacterium GW2011_GWF2_39_17]HCW31873.1 hypothetical protein [Candidatus Peregrinibacteria bacterium]